MSVQQERRAPTIQRIPFDAIVEIGGKDAQDAAFEAQGVDLSESGMHLRTAYLPEQGQPLLCRFQGGGEEISAEGDVVWCREGGRGGEFGVRFTNVDEAGASALLAMCGVTGAMSAGGEVYSDQVDLGSRVRLHIEGLGSPMKARVRQSNGGELLVGSNLEFLKVGRPLQLENVERGEKRGAHIERVEVEVDRASQVPQLVVTLRYDPQDRDERPSRFAPEVADAEPNQAEQTAPRVSHAPGHFSVSEPVQGHANEGSDPIDDEELRAAGYMKSGFARAAERVTPALHRLGARAKTTVSLLVARSREAGNRDSDAPRRTTAAPPGGVLHASGKRVVREELGGEDVAQAAWKPKKLTARTVMSGAGMLLGGSLLMIALHKGSPSSPPGAKSDSGGASSPGSALAAAPTDPSAAGAPPSTSTPGNTSGQAGDLQVNVPLFGATTLAPAEPVLAAATATPPFAVLAGSAPPSPGAAFASSTSSTSSDKPREEDDANDERKAPGHVGSFTHGKIAHEKVLHLRTDGEISAIRGTRSSTGFSFLIPGRKALDSGAVLASKDARISSAKVVQTPKGSEITLRFHDALPPYAIRAKGRDVVIALERGEESSLSASHSDHSSKHVATASKALPSGHRSNHKN